MTARKERADADPPDARLIPLIRDGNEPAFRLLYRRHTPRLRALAFRLLGGHAADTDDVLQETWIRAVQSLPKFSGKSALGTWLGGIAVNVAMELIRRRRPESIGDEQYEPAASNAEWAERMDLDQALARLPDAYRLAVVLHDVEGYSHQEIAEQMGIAEATSRSNLFRARRALRAMLESYERIVE